jgi:hypothetical protein
MDEQPSEVSEEEVNEEEENTWTDGPFEETAVTGADSGRRPTSAPRAVRKRRNETRREEREDDDPCSEIRLVLILFGNCHVLFCLCGYYLVFSTS